LVQFERDDSQGMDAALCARTSESGFRILLNRRIRIIERLSQESDILIRALDVVKWRQTFLRHRCLDSEAVTNGQTNVRVASILPDEIVALPRDHDAGKRGPPVLAARQRVLCLHIDIVTVLANGAFDFERAIGVDRI
jgi:hypothetical protein